MGERSRGWKDEGYGGRLVAYSARYTKVDEWGGWMDGWIDEWISEWSNGWMELKVEQVDGQVIYTRSKMEFFTAKQS